MSLQLKLFGISGVRGDVARRMRRQRADGPPQLEFQLVRVDTERNRRWVLELDSLTVYDNLNGRRLRHIILPGCVSPSHRRLPPGLVLDASGAALVSSNVLPVLWRIDPHFRSPASP